MSQHPRHFHYKFTHYMCDLCQHELRLQAAQVGARASPAQAGGHRKTSPACARSTEVSSHRRFAVPSWDASFCVAVSHGHKYAWGTQAQPARPSLSSTRMHRIVPSSGGQPLAAPTPFAARAGQKASRDHGPDSGTPPSRKVQTLLAHRIGTACPWAGFLCDRCCVDCRQRHRVAPGADGGGLPTVEAAAPAEGGNGAAAAAAPAAERAGTLAHTRAAARTRPGCSTVRMRATTAASWASSAPARCVQPPEALQGRQMCCCKHFVVAQGLPGR